MIPLSDLTAWRAVAPWPSDAQMEQDLVLTRAVVELFGAPSLRGRVAFRGGTALHKILLSTPERYSEDIDLVTTRTEAGGKLVDAVREALDGWLGVPRRSVTSQSATLVYRFESSHEPVQRMRLKVEVNVRESTAYRGHALRLVRVENPWFTGSAEVVTFSPEEMLATKLRALYQRSKGRDLFDLDHALQALDVDEADLVRCFLAYLSAEGHSISRAEFERNLAAKLVDASFRDDVAGLLRPGRLYDATAAGARIQERLIVRLPGAAWKGTG